MVGIVVGAFAYPVAVFAGKVRFRDFARQIAPVQAFAVSTQSSLASLPLMLKKAEALGVRESTAGLVLPMAVALLRVTGPAMNLAVALYVANWFRVELDAFDYGACNFHRCTDLNGRGKPARNGQLCDLDRANMSCAWVFRSSHSPC
jgi:proton glutamate symport protein